MTYNTNFPVTDNIFKAYDIRGIVDETLTVDTVHAIGKALGSEAKKLQQTRIAVARDGRLSGPKLLQALMDGILSTGINVVNVGCVPTPVLYFASFHLNTGCGIMLTGSHNPPNYNGLKMVLNNTTLSGDSIQGLKQRIINKNFETGAGSYREQDISDAYIKCITDDIKLKRPLKIVVDAGNGVAGELAPKLYRALGCDVTELFCDIDGNFPNHHPDPSQPETLATLIDTVKKSGADVGFGFDGDGDRLGVIAPSGEIIWPDRQMILYALDVIDRNPGAEIIYDIKCSVNLHQAISDAGGKATMWKTGHSLVKAKLKETGAPLAGEMSGHIFFKERWFGFDDALYTGARLLEILAKSSQSTQEIFSGLPDMCNTPELRLEMKEGEHFELMKKLIENASFPDARVTDIDGIRVDFEDSWGLVRASNTTPCLVIRFEGRDEAAMKAAQLKFRELFHSVDKNLTLPF
ncbi:MAG TPA: phosphomannomutase/phosphoglucomutase [Gammaproteobacteria bacterium]|nr:phosphomannomutase/phosphoglucomutase [Gammaproteobacteria bacterium]